MVDDITIRFVDATPRGIPVEELADFLKDARSLIAAVCRSGDPDRVAPFLSLIGISEGSASLAFASDRPGEVRAAARFVFDAARRGDVDAVPLRQLDRNGDTIVIAAPTVGEYLARVPLEDHEKAVETFQNRFIILPFDFPAAVTAGVLWIELHKGKSYGDLAAELGVTRQLVKVDMQIAGIAVWRGVDRIYSHEKRFKRYVCGRVEVRGIPPRCEEQALMDV